jgi:hypothetical protein
MYIYAMGVQAWVILEGEGRRDWVPYPLYKILTCHGKITLLGKLINISSTLGHYVCSLALKHGVAIFGIPV